MLSEVVHGDAPLAYLDNAASTQRPRAVLQAMDEAYDVMVDASTGKVLHKISLVQHESEGIVFPNYPGAPKGGQAVKTSFGPTAESPGGYVDPTGLTGVGVTLLGNNADTFKNWSNFIAPALPR